MSEEFDKRSEEFDKFKQICDEAIEQLSNPGPKVDAAIHLVNETYGEMVLVPSPETIKAFEDALLLLHKWLRLFVAPVYRDGLIALERGCQALEKHKNIDIRGEFENAGLAASRLQMKKV